MKVRACGRSGERWWRRLLPLIMSVAVLSALLGRLPRVVALERPEEALNSTVGIFTQLGTQVTLSRTFTDRSGVTGPLSSFVLADKPVVIVPVYYRCPRLCGLLLDGVVQLLNALSLRLGEEFSVLAVSFDPTETPADATKVWQGVEQRLRGTAATGRAAFKFLVGSAEEVSGLMAELGFRYQRDGADFAHSAAVMILTPSGEISQYFTGIEFPEWDARLALVEASAGKVGSAIDHLMLFCFRFDPLQGKYLWAVEGTLRVGGALTLVGLGAVYWFFAFKRRRREGAAG
jgi:protein SCO1/2